ncbi:HlyD family type I secretion periplasmic adaptor subunit [Hoeflea sp. TYP-13]|uniref:HlyD family type I secretion periplasmic adaptor subunit n=1 Tax=Hoeflea sp. TYP-13 TaxID=3230023 RepID=UPI0034C5C67B
MKRQTPSHRLRRSIRGLWALGIGVILICIIGFAGWATFTKLSSAAIADGQVSPDGSQRTVQHLEGGIIRNMYVKEGDLVKTGQVLVVLDKVLAEANFRSRYRKLQRLMIVRTRLMAQERGEGDFKPPITEEMQLDPTYREFVENEISTFHLKQRLMTEQLDIYQRQELQVHREIDSLMAQSKGFLDQVVFLEKEIEVKKGLLKVGLVRAPELYALQRKHAELSSESDAILSTVARARQKIEEIGIAKITLKTEALDQIAEQLAQVNTDIAQTEEALNATDDVLLRTRIVSPIEGRVLKLNIRTIGGVVRPGEPILTIVPIDEELIIDARLSPTDIDNVNLGMLAKVQLSSFMARHMLPLDGEVIHIGADVVTDPDTREKFFALRVRVDRDELAERTDGVDLHPGMPAEVFVQTGVHSPLRYIFDPIMKSFNRAFREETT